MRLSVIFANHTDHALIGLTGKPLPGNWPGRQLLHHKGPNKTLVPCTYVERDMRRVPYTVPTVRDSMNFANRGPGCDQVL